MKADGTPDDEDNDNAAPAAETLPFANFDALAADVAGTDSPAVPRPLRLFPSAEVVAGAGVEPASAVPFVCPDGGGGPTLGPESCLVWLGVLEDSWWLLEML